MDPGPSIRVSGGALWRGGAAPVARADVIVRDGRIAAILDPQTGNAGDWDSAVDQVVNASGMLVMPPFFDAHVHSNATLLRGTENSFPLELWSYYAIGYGLAFDAEAVTTAVQLTAVEMIDNGIGGYIDHFPPAHLSHAALDAHLQSGLRVGFAPFFADLADENILGIPVGKELAGMLVPKSPRHGDRVAALFHELHSRIAAEPTDTVSLLLGPNAPQRCSPDLWRTWRDLIDQLGCGSHTHLLETRPQALHCRQRWPHGVVEELDRQGLLGPGMSAAHAIWLTDPEMDLLARRGVLVSHNPVSNRMLGSGAMNVQRMLGAGVQLALGTDSSNTGGRHELFEVLRQMMTSGRAPGSDFSQWITPSQALHAATRGVGVLGQAHAKGTLEPGAAADLLLVDFESAGLISAPVSLEALACHGDARNVHSMMVDGEWLMRERVHLKFDVAGLAQKARAIAERLRAAMPLRANRIGGLHARFAEWSGAHYAGMACAHCGLTALRAPAP